VRKSGCSPKSAGNVNGREPSADRKPDGISSFELKRSGTRARAEGTVGVPQDAIKARSASKREERGIEKLLYASAKELYMLF